MEAIYKNETNKRTTAVSYNQTQPNVIKIESPALLNPYIPSLVSCYRSVFASRPWSEYKICPVCSQRWGIEDKTELQKMGFKHCGQVLRDFHNLEDIKRGVEEIFDYPMSSVWLALYRGKVIGFCFGYGIGIDSLEMKFKIYNLAKSLRLVFGQDLDLVAYQNDLGVLEKFRGLGIARTMFFRRHEDFLAHGLQVGIVWTKEEPPTVTYLWYKKSLGYQVVHDCKDFERRVILARSLSTLNSK